MKNFTKRKGLLIVVIALLVGVGGFSADDIFKTLDMYQAISGGSNSDNSNGAQPSHNVSANIGNNNDDSGNNGLPSSSFSADGKTGDTTAAKRVIVISPSRRAHILYGDEGGGGHIYGAGKPCKTEFPKEWSEDRIIKTLSTMAANDNANWRVEYNGYHVSEQKVDGLDIRVVVNRDMSDVVTGYPLNVPRNPCPAEDGTGKNEDTTATKNPPANDNNERDGGTAPTSSP